MLSRSRRGSLGPGLFGRTSGFLEVLSCSRPGGVRKVSRPRPGTVRRSSGQRGRGRGGGAVGRSPDEGPAVSCRCETSGSSD